MCYIIQEKKQNMLQLNAARELRLLIAGTGPSIIIIIIIIDRVFQ